jgi:hypothetical protein
MKRQQRRRVEARIGKLIETDGDNCSICRAPFQHNHRTYGGATDQLSAGQRWNP